MKIQRNVDKIRREKSDTGSRKRIKGKKTAVLIMAAVCVLLWLWTGMYRRWQENHSGIPDAVSSRTENGECFLDVIANTDEIEDKEEFARTVIRMCRENSFRSLRLSTDLYGYPERIEIDVYFHRGDVNKRKPVLRIRYETTGFSAGKECGSGPDKKDYVEKYKLYVDGKEIPCYY